MAEIPMPETGHLASLSLPALNLEIFCEPALVETVGPLTARIERLWPHFVETAQSQGVFAHLGLDPSRHTLEMELNWIGNAAMHRLNLEYRGKDAPTDVLTFTLLADAPDPGPWLQLPVISLGSVFVSVEWARAAVTGGEDSPDLSRYLLERVVHGMLHLLGQHHDTMPAFERVVAIQNRVLEAAFAP